MDFLVRNEPFQGIVATPQGKNLLFAPSPRSLSPTAAFFGNRGNILPQFSIFTRKKCPVMGLVGFSLRSRRGRRFRPAASCFRKGADSRAPPKGTSTMTKVMKFGVGQGVRRVEDVRLVSGQGKYASDAVENAELRAVFLRSPYGHAKFRVDSVEAARAAPGVRAVYAASRFCRPRRPALPCSGFERRRVGDAAQAVSGDGDGRSAARRRHRRDGGRRHDSSGARRRRTDRRHMGGTSRRRRHGRGRPARSAARLCRRAREYRLRHLYRRPAEGPTPPSRPPRIRFASRS